MRKEGWEYKKLGEVCVIERGGSPRPISSYITTDEDGINWIKIGDAVEGSKYISSTKERIKKEGMKKSRYVRKGDFILSNSMSFGKPYILNIDGCIHDGWLVLHDENNAFIKDYLYYLLSSPTMYSNFKKLAVGGVVNNLNSALVRSVRVAIPPLSQQQSIVAELDKINEIIDLKKAQLKDLDLLAQSIFYEMFGDPIENPKGWEVKKLGEVSKVKIGPFGSLLHKSDYVSGGTPLVNPIHMKDGHIVKDDNFTITDEKKNEMSAYLLKEGDVLFARRGEIGRSAIVTKYEDGYLCGTGSLFVRFQERLNNVFVLYWTNSKSFITELVSQAKGATMLNINCKIVEDLKIILPPLSLQQSFASKIQSIESQKSAIKQSLAEAETLLASRMDYWFG